ncbi:MAG: zinc-regulated TonB-dependent outer membrane receptor [Myxococcales bacterium]|nr:zinc-regulated TonB-dependent outer membrane receptor [Myxococcales bacterium]
MPRALAFVSLSVVTVSLVHPPSAAAQAAGGDRAGSPKGQGPSGAALVPDERPNTEGGDTAVSADEMKQLEGAAAADSAARAESEKSAPPPSAPAPQRRGSLATFIQSMNPDLALILDVAGAVFSAKDPNMLGGHDPTRTGFNLQQLELHLGASVDPYFRLDANIVFSLDGVEVEEAYGTTLGLPAGLQLRAGQFLTQFGRINSTHPHAWHFADIPLANAKFFGSDGSRGLGVELSWLTPLPWYTELVVSGTMPDSGDCCSHSFYGDQSVDITGPGSFLYTFALKQFFDLSRDWSAYWGLSAQVGPNPTGHRHRTEIYGTDLYIRYRPVHSQTRTAVSLQIEGMGRRRDGPTHTLVDWGGYGQLIWNINREWEVGGRYGFATGLDDDYLDPTWTGLRQRASVQTTFYPSHFSRLRLQGNWDSSSWLDKPVWGGILALELVIGAHGAHKY